MREFAVEDGNGTADFDAAFAEIIHDAAGEFVEFDIDERGEELAAMGAALGRNFWNGWRGWRCGGQQGWLGHGLLLKTLLR